jgi:hypothetical protein
MQLRRSPTNKKGKERIRMRQRERRRIRSRRSRRIISNQTLKFQE